MKYNKHLLVCLFLLVGVIGTGFVYYSNKTIGKTIWAGNFSNTDDLGLIDPMFDISYQDSDIVVISFPNPENSSLKNRISGGQINVTPKMVVALDIDTGKELWKFETAMQPQIQKINNDKLLIKWGEESYVSNTSGYKIVEKISGNEIKNSYKYFTVLKILTNNNEPSLLWINQSNKVEIINTSDGSVISEMKIDRTDSEVNNIIVSNNIETVDKIYSLSHPIHIKDSWTMQAINLPDLKESWTRSIGNKDTYRFNTVYEDSERLVLLEILQNGGVNFIAISKIDGKTEWTKSFDARFDGSSFRILKDRAIWVLTKKGSKLGILNFVDGSTKDLDTGILGLTLLSVYEDTNVFTSRDSNKLLIVSGNLENTRLANVDIESGSISRAEISSHSDFVTLTKELQKDYVAFSIYPNIYTLDLNSPEIKLNIIKDTKHCELDTSVYDSKTSSLIAICSNKIIRIDKNGKMDTIAKGDSGGFNTYYSLKFSYFDGKVIWGKSYSRNETSSYGSEPGTESSKFNLDIELKEI